MRSRLKAALVTGAALALMVAAAPAMAGIPDITNSFFQPQSGTVAAPATGTLATRFFRMCPNNDGGSSLPSNARIKVTVRDVNNNPIPNIAAADICVLFNGGTSAQGFSGTGADSIIANSLWNPTPLCPDLRCVAADAPTDTLGTTYITFAGANVNTPGVTLRNSNRKWGHYDTELPVYVLGFKLGGRLNPGDNIGTYQLRIKNFDLTGGLTAVSNAGELVSANDANTIANGFGVSNAVSYWRDFDSSGAVTVTDGNSILGHILHDCDTPNNP